MNRHFSIGYLRGSLYGIWLGVAGMLVMAVVTQRLVFLLGVFILEIIALLIWLMKNELEKQL